MITITLSVPNAETYSLPYTKFTLIDELNSYSSLWITIDFEELKKRIGTEDIDDILTSGKREIIVSEDGDAMFTGQLTDIDLNNVSGVISLVLSATDYYGVLRRRLIGIPETIYRDIDAGLIAWGCINETQQSDLPYSDLGITQGSIDPSKNRDKQYQFRFVDDAIVTISNFNLYDGFDFEVDEDKKFNVFYPRKGSQREELTITPNFVANWNINKVLPRDLTNRVVVKGESSLWVQRESSIAVRNAYGVQDELLSAYQIKEMDTLTDKGDKYLRNNETPLDTLTVNLLPVWNYNEFSVGDSFRIDVEHLGLDYEWYRLYRSKLTYNNTETQQFSLQFTQEQIAP